MGHYADEYAARDALGRTIAVRVGDWRELHAEVERLRAIEAAATALRARVREWGAVPFRGAGHEEEYELATNAAGDAILVAASAYDAAARSNDDTPR